MGDGEWGIGTWNRGWLKLVVAQAKTQSSGWIKPGGRWVKIPCLLATLGEGRVNAYPSAERSDRSVDGVGGGSFIQVFLVGY